MNIIRYGFIISLLVMFPVLTEAAPPPQSEVWNFTVALDGKNIGTQLFTLSVDRSNKKFWHLETEANFTATIIGVPVYRYHHKADESWSGGCLTALTADTNDDGSLSHVEGKDEKVHVTKSKGEPSPGVSWEGCLMSFAYWNPEMRQQKRLLNPQTGDIEDVTITELPPATISVHGRDVQAKVWRVAGKHEPVDVLYGQDGEWIGLNAETEGGYALTYRLP